MTIETKQLRNMYLSTDVVTNVSVINDVQPNVSAVVNSGAIYNALSDLSAVLVGQLKPQTKVDSKTFDFSEVPTVKVDGVENDRHVIVKNGDSFELSTVNGYGVGSQYFRIPSIVSLNNGRKVVIFDVRWNSTQDIGATDASYDIITGEIHTDDYGNTWSQPKCITEWLYPDYDPSIPITDYQSGASDPGIMYDEEHNVIMVFSLGGYGLHTNSREGSLLSGDLPYSDLSSYKYQQLVMTYSKDNGETWSKPKGVTNRIFDSNGTTQEWARTYRYCFSTCTTGITLNQQSNSEYNGTMIFPVQFSPNKIDNTSTWFSHLRVSFVKVEPTYDENNDIIDIKLTLLSDGNNQIMLGEECGGANECSICEGPNGELAAVVRAYSVYLNPNGIYKDSSGASKSAIRTRIYKSDGLYQTWSLVGDDSSGSDVICTTLETTGNTKPGLVWSQQLGAYICGYVESLYSSGDIRTNLILRSSYDLINWDYLTSLEFNNGMGYITFVPQRDNSKFAECIYEAYNEYVNAGSSKQLKYAAFKINGGNSYLFSTINIDQANIVQNYSIQGFAFNLSKAPSPGIMFSTSNVIYPISKMKVFWGGYSSSQQYLYCIIYDADDNNATPITYSTITNASSQNNFPDNFTIFNFVKPITINPKINHTYFVKFAIAANGIIPDNVMTQSRGAISGTTNAADIKTFVSRFNTEDYMKVYRNASVIKAGTPSTNQYPVSIQFELY